MQIHCTVGIGLDSGVSIDEQAPLGHITVNTTWLLFWLESQLGLQRPQATFTARVLAYRACLKAFDTPKRFYHDSFAVDPLGVAKELLRWRDLWHLNGWDGQPLSNASERLNTMAEMESRATLTVPLNEGQRVSRVISELQNCPLDLAVHSIDALEDYPATWQQLLRHLGASVQAPEKAVCAETNTDLAQIQAALRGDSSTTPPCTLSEDGSFLVLKAPSRDLSATWLAHAYRHTLSEYSDSDTLLLSEGNAEAIDLALRENGLPRMALGAASPWRPVLQLLPLTLELLWEPLNPARLLEFLTHPVGPLPRRVRHRLAEVVAQQPGIGGAEWNAAIKTILAEAAEQYDNDKERQDAQTVLQQKIDFWLAGQRHAPYPGAPLADIELRVQSLLDWIMARSTTMEKDDPDNTEISLYRSAARQMSEMLTALDDLATQGESLIDADSLRRLIDSVRGDGGARPDVRGELQPGLPRLALASTPASCLSARDTIIWWGADDALPIKRYPWSKTELHALRDNGVELLPIERQAQWQAASWLRPIFAAKKQLVMVVHEDTETQHPIFDQLHALAKELPTAELLPHLQGQTHRQLDASIAINSEPMRALPCKERTWQIDKSIRIAKRDSESYSSLDSFIYGPYLWVLRYGAKLREGRWLALSDNNLLKGTLAHQLFEDYFAANPEIAHIDPAQAHSWGTSRLRDLLTQQGAVLLMPGRAGERERFIADTLRAMQTLIEHLKSAGVVTVEMETQANATFVGGKLSGRLDLLATKRDGTEAIVDIKWGGGKYRRAALKDSRYLQLAIYAQLRRQSTASLPAVGYYIIASRELLVLDTDFFPDADVVQPSNEESLLEFWQRFEHSWKQRRKQLDQGLIEVNVSGTEPDEALLLDDKGLANEEVFESFSEFGNLVGWEADA